MRASKIVGEQGQGHGCQAGTHQRNHLSREQAAECAMSKDLKHGNPS